MAKFHFENNDKDLGETRRIDDINRQIQQLDKKNSEADIAKNNNTDNSTKSGEKENVFLFSPKIAVVLIVVAFIFIAGIGFLLVSILSEQGHKGNNASASSSGDGVASTGEKQINYAFITSVNENMADLYSISTDTKIEAPFSSSVVITGATGGKLSKSDLRRGLLVSVDISSDGKISCIRWPKDAWHIDSTTGIKTDAKAMKITIGHENYSYDNDAMFLYKDDEINPGDIDESDTVTLYGVKDKLLSAIVEHRHGNIVLKNAENIENLSVFIDLTRVQNIENMIIPVPTGKHNVVISGTNISDFLCNVDINDKDNVEIDLSGSADNKRIKISSNAKSYNVTVNGNTYAPNTSEIAVKKGVYQVTISAPGYKSETYTADCSTDNAEINAQLEESGTPDSTSQSDKTTQSKQNTTEYVTINSKPSWARIYVDGKYIGVSPVMVSLSHGQHTVTAQLDGKDNIYQDIQVNTPDQTVTMDFGE